MVPYKKRTGFRHSWPWWRWALTGLILLALAMSIILSWHSLVQGAMIGCNAGSACDQVINSRWSTIAGVLPVSVLALGVYMAMLVAGCFIGPTVVTPVRRLAWVALLVLVGSAAGSAVWFTIVQKFKIGVFCPYCMTAHLSGMLLAVLVIWQAPRQLDTNSTRSIARRIVGLWPIVGWNSVGLALAGVLVVCQIAVTPPAVYLEGESHVSLSAFDPNTGPVVGSPDADYVVTLLFDYQCLHCQQMHFMLNEVVRRYDGKLAFALCPSPLNGQCNPYISGDVEQYRDSCELARVALAVWLAMPDAFVVFENWMFTFETGDRWQPRTLDAARAKAIELVGQADFDAAWANPWIEHYMQNSIHIYGQTLQGGNSGVPKLVYGSRWVIPEPYNVEDLMRILSEVWDF